MRIAIGSLMHRPRDHTTESIRAHETGARWGCRVENLRHFLLHHPIDYLMGNCFLDFEGLIGP